MSGCEGASARVCGEGDDRADVDAAVHAEVRLGFGGPFNECVFHLRGEWEESTLEDGGVAVGACWDPADGAGAGGVEAFPLAARRCTEVGPDMFEGTRVFGVDS
jgi:hypothetical protein